MKLGSPLQTALTYDRNGNIQTLNRKGGTEGIYTPTIDNLKYFYASNSNLLKKVVDLTNNPNGFKDDSNGTIASDPENDYRYDQFGNMTADQNKQIERIRYNHLNLPTEIVFTNDRLIRYTYDASGTKMKKVAVSPSSENVTLYRDGFQYSKRNNEALKLQFFPTAEGYVKAVYEGTSTSPRFQYVYNYTDHLGNIRLSYLDADDNGTINASTEIIEEDNYYPFGLKQQGYNNVAPVLDRSYKYKYNGKELQEEFGLNWYDYQARNYDPATGRWMNIDPLSEMSRRFSPYTYALDNPVFFVDPDGMLATPPGDFYNEKGKKIGNDGIKDGKVYVIKTSNTKLDTLPTDPVSFNGITSEQATNTENFIKNNSGDTNAFKDNSIAYDNSVELVGDKSQREKISKHLTKDNGQGGTVAKNNKEYSVVMSNKGNLNKSEGSVTDPTIAKSTEVSMNPSKNDIMEGHSHPSGYKIIMNSDGSGNKYRYYQAPSKPDQNLVGNRQGVVFGRANGTVYIYNKSGVVATMPTKTYKK